MLTNFQNSFNKTFSGQVSIKRSSKIEMHLKRISHGIITVIFLKMWH